MLRHAPRARRHRAVAVVAVTLPALSLLGACGSSEASVADFCDAYEVVQRAGDEETEIAAEVAQVQEAYAAFEEVGTPAGMPDDAREGFEVLGDVVSGVSEDASQEDLDQLDEQVRGADQDKVEAFFAYVAQECEPGAG